MCSNPTLLNLLKKYREKIINYWLRKVNIDTIEKSFLIDPLTSNDAIYCDSLTLEILQNSHLKKTKNDLLPTKL